VIENIIGIVNNMQFSHNFTFVTGNNGTGKTESIMKGLQDYPGKTYFVAERIWAQSCGSGIVAHCNNLNETYSVDWRKQQEEYVKQLLINVEYWLKNILQSKINTEYLNVNVGSLCSDGCSVYKGVRGGYNSLLPFVVTALHAKKDELVVCFNPESELSPSSQIRFIRFLIRMNQTIGSRFVIETHSQYLLTELRVVVRKGLLLPDDIIIEFFTHDKESIYNGNDAIYIDKWGQLINKPKDFFDEYSRQLDELLK